MQSRTLRKCALLIAPMLIAACGNKEVSFKADVDPLLRKHCVECHNEKGDGYKQSGLLLTSYESLMKGTRYGAIIKPGDGVGSTLVMLVEGRANPAINMPHGRLPLPKAETAILRHWVEQGAKNN